MRRYSGKGGKMWQLTKHKYWGALEEQFEWVQAMAHTPQDPIHHAEGNVAVHTQMVLDELTNHSEFKQLAIDDQEIVWTAALMHDMEKRSTTVLEDDGSITSKGHAKKGELSARTWLYKHHSTPFWAREQIAKLVRYHGLPLWLFEKQDPTKAVLQTSLEVNIPWLSMLAEADSRGRECTDKAELLYRNDLFKAYCGEVGCWQHPFTFKSPLGRFLYCRKGNYSPDYEPFDDTTNEVILLSGLPGMGKDHYVQQHFKDWEMVSLDNIRRHFGVEPTDSKANGRVIQEAKEAAKKCLRRREPFVFNATNISRSMREIWIDLFTSYGAKTKIIYLEVPYKQWISQNKNRQFPVPEAVLHRMLSKWEVPTLWEAHTVEYIV